MFRALLLEMRDGAITASIRELEDSALPSGNVTVAVEFTTVNYKDGLVIHGGGGLVKHWPHVPGIDFVGTVLTSDDPAYRAGDKVILTGWRVGEIQWGGCAQKATVKAEHLVPLPTGLTTWQAMAIGTAGFTAMLAVMALEEHGLTPAAGDVLVTGASGGEGTMGRVHRLRRRQYACESISSDEVWLLRGRSGSRERQQARTYRAAVYSPRH